jgi:hypothetical protein
MRVTKPVDSGTIWNGGPQRVTVPYTASNWSLEGYLSRSSHVEPRLKLRGPSRKAKYSLMTDSEPSRATERWEEPLLGEDSEPETMCLQAVGGLCPARGMPDGVPFA